MTDLNSFIEAYKDAVFQKNLDAFASIFDEQVRVFDMWEQWTYEGLNAWLEKAKSWFATLGTDRDEISFYNIQIQEAGEMAFVSAILRFTAVSENGEAHRYLENRHTWVARKKEHSWKIVHQHSSGPVDSKTMRVILKR